MRQRQFNDSTFQRFELADHTDMLSRAVQYQAPNIAWRNGFRISVPRLVGTGQDRTAGFGPAANQPPPPRPGCRPRRLGKHKMCGDALGSSQWLAVSGALLTVALSRQGFLHSFLLARLEVKSVPLDVLDDVLLEDFSFEALECAFQAFAFVNVNFSQRATSVSNQIRVFSVAVSRPVPPPRARVHLLRSGVALLKTLSAAQRIGLLTCTFFPFERCR